METKAFRQAFPNTPIFGFFGGGEIGLNHLPKFQKQEEDDQGVRHKKRKKRMLHQFSTIIVLLSFLWYILWSVFQLLCIIVIEVNHKFFHKTRVIIIIQLMR